MKQQIEELMKEWKEKPVDPSTLPHKLPVDSVENHAGLFQYRWGMDSITGVSCERHVENLGKSLADGDLDPVVVLHVAGRNLLLDGHHRVAAYREASKDIPVTYYEGSPEQALIDAGRENNKDRLPTSKVERSQRAWVLVNSGIKYSKTQIHDSTSVSPRTISSMRAKKREYEESGKEVPESWIDVLNGGKERLDFESDAQADAWINEQAEKWAQTLRKLPVLDTETKALILARAIIAFSPGRAEDVARRLLTSLDMWEDMLEQARKEVVEEGKDYGF